MTDDERVVASGGPVALPGIGGLTYGVVALTVSDINMSIEWYCDNLGSELFHVGRFEVGYHGRPVTVQSACLEGLGTLLELLSSSMTGWKPRADPPSHLFDPSIKCLLLWTPEFEDVVTGLREKGVEFLWDDEVLPNGRGGAVIMDPDFNLINIFSPEGRYGPADLPHGLAEKRSSYPPTFEEFGPFVPPRLIDGGRLLP